MTEIRKIVKKDIPALLENVAFWKQSFLPISRHRLYAHYKNPSTDEDDVVLLLALADDEVVGYMGVFIEKITLNGISDKIGWLSTWWVHPKTKGTGIGREILNTMYDINGGKIGISQFTPSAKRVYDKSGYFTTLKENHGIKAVLKSNTAFLMPVAYPKTKPLKIFFRLTDAIINVPIAVKLYFSKKAIARELLGISLEYMTAIDPETQQIIETFQGNRFSKRNAAFFEWLKAYNWVQEAPLLEYTQKEKYEFSIYDKSFAIYLVKILKNDSCLGFIVLQRRNKTLKVLYGFYDKTRHSNVVANIIKQHAIVQNCNEIICYEADLCENFKESGIFLYTRKKLKQSIISKVFNKTDFSDVSMSFGDGDCSFA